MPPTHDLRMLLRYNAWANARLFSALGALPAQEIHKPMVPGVGSIARALNHALVVDQIWQAHLEGRPHGFSSRNTEQEPSLSELQASQSRLDKWYIDYADTLSEADLDEPVSFQFVDGGAGCLRRADMMLHTVNHKTYHRGYVAVVLYQLGGKPPVMDLPVFLRDAPPQV
ncbi:DinB family protein [Paracidovorax anthurii]|uniref:Putative damage-inducible protein DinB n=1 Tax=Paracidovorax anthurii TaxID=78229 RepID=A0A328ZE25_9BURK|nr:DinB family protein [Paracidovorax anthurii]RAR81027.1 putative damage-inducible protein DinB [Paracidovorax anthurii]